MNIIAQIEQKVKAKEAKKARLEQLIKLKLSDFIEDNEIKEIEKEIEELEKELKLNKLKNTKNFDSFFDEIDLKPEDLENIKTEYIVDGFIVKNDITTLVAPQNAGKSTLAVSIVNHFLTKETSATVYYFDFDNSRETQAERGIGKLKEKFGKNLRYLSEVKATPQKMKEAMIKLSKSKLDNTLVVIDNIKNLIIGDRDKNRDVSAAMNKLKRLRANGATIIALHHTNKHGKDGDLIFAGSSAFLEDTANAYLIKRNDFKQAFTLEILKNRTGKLEKNIAFKFTNNHQLIKIDYAEASETQEIIEISEEIIDFLEKQAQKPTYSKIMQHLQKQGYSRNKSNQAVQAGKGRYWEEEKLTQNNKSVYSLIRRNQKSDKSLRDYIEIEYRDEDNHLIKTEQQIIQNIKNTRISDTSRTSPTLGLCEINTTTIQPIQVQSNQINMPII